MGRPSDGPPSLRASLAPLNVRRRMHLGRHCQAPPLATQPSQAPTIRHGGVIRSVLNRTLEIARDGMLGGLNGLQCGTIAGRSGIVYALADSTV